MAVDKTMVIVVLVFICGLLAGILFTGLLYPLRQNPAKQVVFTERIPQLIEPLS